MHQYLMTPQHQIDGGPRPILTPEDLVHLPLPGNISNVTKKEQRALASVGSPIQPCEAKSAVSVCVSAVSVPLSTSNNHKGSHQSTVKCLTANKSKSEARSLDLRSPRRGHLSLCHKTARAVQSRWILLACFTSGRTDM